MSNTLVNIWPFLSSKSVRIVVYTRGFHSEGIVYSGLERPLVVQYGNIK